MTIEEAFDWAQANMPLQKPIIVDRFDGDMVLRY